VPVSTRADLTAEEFVTASDTIQRRGSSLGDLDMRARGDRLSRSGRPCCAPARGADSVSVAGGGRSRRPVEDAGP
jgi:hypothetical protein